MSDDGMRTMEPGARRPRGRYGGPVDVPAFESAASCSFRAIGASVGLGVPDGPAPAPGRRRGRGRTPASVPAFGSLAVDHLLGTDSDRAVAERCGMWIHDVWRRRHALGIAAGGRRGPRSRDPAVAERHAAILAMAADGRRDAAIAVALGVSRTLVGIVRAAAGMPSYGTACRNRLLESGLLGTMPDEALAGMFGMTPHIVGAARRAAGIAAKPCRRELAPDVVARLGREPDAAIARDAGLRLHVVRLARVARGLPPTRPRTASRAWTAADDRRMGRDSDRAVADRLGITACMVAMRRQRLGIPAWRRP